MSTCRLFIPFLCALLFSCSENKHDTGNQDDVTTSSFDDNENLEQMVTDETEGNIGNKNLSQTINGLTFSVNYMSAKEFLEKKGEQIDPKDADGLEKEQVFLLEISLPDPARGIFDDKRLSMTNDDAVTYLNQQISQDFGVTQSGKEFIPNAVNYEGTFFQKNKIRCVFFFSGLKFDKKFKITFYDRLFQTGLMKFNS